MSIPSVYLKSDTNILEEINLDNYVYKDYELTIYPVNGRALNVSSTKNIVDKTITFNNLIKYDNDGKVFEWKNNSWTLITNYFESTYEGIKIYENNLYSSIKTEISSKTININKPWFYMMYGPSSSESVSRVTSITFQNNIYTFNSDIGKVEFDILGNPVRSLTTGNLPTVPLLRFVVYRYNGFSQMTSSYLTNLYNSLPICTTDPSTSTQYIYYWNRCGFNVEQLSIYIYGEFIGSSGNSQRTVHKIYKNINDPRWDLLFFITDNNSTDKGVSFKLNGTPVKVYERGENFWNEGDITSDVGYRIYRKDGFTNFIPNSSTKVLSSYIYKTISRDIIYQIDNPSNQFQIQIPNNKPTNRIFVYQTNNKLLHITDYIPKGTTQNVTIRYTNNNGVLNVTSSVVPVNPLPVPILISDGNSGGYVNGYAKNYISLTDDFAHITDTRGCPHGSIVYNIQTKDCAWPVVGMYYNCKNPYTPSEPPFSPYGGWVGRTNGCNYNTVTSDEGYSGMYAEAGKFLDKIIFKMPNGTSKTIGRDGGKNSLNDYNCPNGKIVGFKIRTDRLNNGGDDGIYAGIQAYCASPKIP